MSSMSLDGAQVYKKSEKFTYAARVCPGTAIQDGKIMQLAVNTEEGKYLVFPKNSFLFEKAKQDRDDGLLEDVTDDNLVEEILKLANEELKKGEIK